MTTEPKPTNVVDIAALRAAKFDNNRLWTPRQMVLEMVRYYDEHGWPPSAILIGVEVTESRFETDHTMSNVKSSEVVAALERVKFKVLRDTT